MALVGVGDIGRNVARRALAADMSVRGYDPAFDPRTVPSEVEQCEWPRGLDKADFIVFTCALTDSNFHMFDSDCVSRLKPGVRVVNVARGGLIDEAALVDGLRRGIVHSAALDVMECEPLLQASPLREFESCVFGSHNASNTEEAVIRTTTRAIEELFICLARQ
jgi:D-3-phosphoglycerate dehydrogenase